MKLNLKFVDTKGYDVLVDGSVVANGIWSLAVVAFVDGKEIRCPIYNLHDMQSVTLEVGDMGSGMHIDITSGGIILPAAAVGDQFVGPVLYKDSKKTHICGRVSLCGIESEFTVATWGHTRYHLKQDFLSATEAIKEVKSADDFDKKVAAAKAAFLTINAFDTAFAAYTVEDFIAGKKLEYFAATKTA